MGSWNHTCALSYLPVMSNEPVYVFFLLESPNFEKYVGSHCYSGTYYNLLPLHFEGEYNDYGAVDKCKGLLLDTIILPTITKNLIELPVGENECHDIEIKKEGFNIEKLFDADHESRLFLKPWYFKDSNDKTRLTHIVIRKNVLKELLNKYKFTSFRPILKGNDSKGKPYDYNYNYKFSDLKKEATDFIDVYKKLDNKDNRDFLALSHLKLMSFFGNSVFSSREGEWQHIFRGQELIEDYISDEKITSELVHQYCVFNLLTIFMDRSRRNWIKPCGQGSQDSETDAQEFMANLTLRESKRIKDYFEE